MTESHYHLGQHGQAPVIKSHSLAKHKVLRSYLQSYFKTLTLAPAQEVLKLTLVDGFAGWGTYTHDITGKDVPGSPRIMLETVEEASKAINDDRCKPLTFDVTYFFVEKDSGAYAYLETQIKKYHDEQMRSSSINLLNKPFECVADGIIEKIKEKTPRARRAIFLLDQYGYANVDTKLIRKILEELPGSEVILTFNVDAMLTYANNENIEKLLSSINIPNTFNGLSIEEIKRNDARWRLYIQSVLYPELVLACGAKFYTLFFIRSPHGHGDYWLIHLSQHPKARDVMTCTHWDNSNHFIHYGGAGIDMFNAIGFDPRHENILFPFDDEAKERCINALIDQIPEIVYNRHPHGITFKELFQTTCNLSPADESLYKQATAHLIANKYLTATSSSGIIRRSTSENDDLLIAPRQLRLFF